MCGIVGILDFSKSGFFQKDVPVFKELLIVNSLRGSHSTGMFGGRIGGEMDFAKAVGNPYDFINSKDVEPIFEKMVRKHRIVVGHGRHATRGSIIGEYAHPFQKDHITMVHNGTVFSSNLIDTMKHVSDSKAICEALASNSAEEVFADINGAYAIAYHNSKNKTFSLVRNKERPLVMALDEKNDRVYFSSEKNILEVVAYRNGISFKETLRLPEEVLFTFEEGNINPVETKIKKKPVVYQVPKTYTPSTTTSNPPVNIIAVTSPSTGVRIKVGEKIMFSPTDFHETVSRTKDETSFFQIFGSVPNFLEVETTIIFKGTEKEIYDHSYWEGTVASIVMASTSMKSKGTSWFIYLKEAKPSDNVCLSDGSFIPKEEYLRHTSNGCVGCGTPLYVKDSESVLIMNEKAICEECTITYFNTLPKEKEAA